MGILYIEKLISIAMKFWRKLEIKLNGRQEKRNIAVVKNPASEEAG